MNVYLCTHKLDCYGFYVAEETRGKAKVYFAAEEGCDFTDVRTSIVRRGVSNKFYGFLNEEELKELNIDFVAESEY